jgi:tight adherence protein C
VYVVLAALAVSLSVLVLWHSFAADRVPGGQVNQNLRAGLAEGVDLRRLVLSQSPLERIFQPLARVFGRVAHRVSPSGAVSALERRIELSGVTWPLERYLMLKLALGGGFVAAGLLWAYTSGSTTGVLLGIGAGIVGYLGPDLGFDSAMARTSKSGKGPLAQEITRLLQDLRIGVPREEALAGVLDRTDVPELRQFLHAVMQAESYGVPISRVLRTQAAEQREKRRFRAEERAMQLPVKVIFPLAFCILPVLFIVVIGPAFVHMAGGLK